MTKEGVSKRREAGGIILLGGAFLFALIFWGPPKMSGPLGSFLRDTGRSLIGSLAYVLPLILVYFALEVFLAKQKEVSQKRQLLALLLVLFLLTFIAIFALNDDRISHFAMEDGKFKATRALQAIWDSGKDNQLANKGDFWNGGILGSVIALGLLSLLGKAGAILVTLVTLLALALLLFNFSYVYYIRHGYDVLKLKHEEFRVKREESLAEKEAARAAFEAELRRQELQERRDAARAQMELKEKLRQKAIQQEREEGWDTPDSVQDLHIRNRYEPPQRSMPFKDYPTAETASEEQQSFSRPEQMLPQEREPYRVQAEFTQDDLSFNLPGGDWRIQGDPVTASPIEFETEPVAHEPVIQEPVVHEPVVEPTVVEPVVTDDTAPVVPEVVTKETPEATDAEIEKRAEEIEALDESLQEGTDRDTWEDRAEDTSPTEKKCFHTVYHAPPLNLLKKEPQVQQTVEQEAEIKKLGATLEKTLNDFGVDAKVINYTSGPTISRFELVPGPGVKVSRIVNLADDIALALAAIAVRIEAPIPGKSAIGIEIPNKQTSAVLLRGILEDPTYRRQDAPLLSALGRDIQGEPILCDLAKMPHLLIAGATGSGKSVCINSILISLLYRTSPEDLRLLMVDPKVVELSVYNGIPHLLQPVITDPKKATNGLSWAVEEMTRRYRLFADAHVRDFASYNRWVAEGHTHENKMMSSTKLPYIVIIIDELSDLMATAASDVEDAISRLTAMARAAGMHLIIATQRPSVDVITGVIKANIPSRIAFAVASQVDSRTILDQAGAEKLLGKGDMLYAPQSASKSLRGQGAFVTDREVEAVVSYLKDRYGEQYDENVADAIEKAGMSGNGGGIGGTDDEDLDELIDDAMAIVFDNEYASISLLQRRLNVGYPRAARMVDQLHDLGAIGPFEGSKPRKVTVKSMDEYYALKNGEGTGAEQ